MSTQMLLVGNTQVLSVSGLQYGDGSGYINDAVVTVTLTHRNGKAVSGQNWPLTLDYVLGSDGNYEGVLSSALVLSDNSRYTVEITASTSGGDAFWHDSVEAQYREFD